MVKFVIFDLDGTLLNTIRDLAVACDVVLARRNLPQHSYDEYCSFVGNGIMRLVERSLPGELRSVEYVSEVRRDFIEYYTEHIDVYTRPYEGIVELLFALQQRGVHLAIASNKFQAGTEKLAQRFFPNIHFDAVLGQRPDIPLKPNPAIVNEILLKTNTATSDVLYVGDSGIDIQTAHAAGVCAVGVTWGFRSREELEENVPQYIVDCASQIATLVEG
jgi:phosphoglycolate phosphatase